MYQWGTKLLRKPVVAEFWEGHSGTGEKAGGSRREQVGRLGRGAPLSSLERHPGVGWAPELTRPISAAGLMERQCARAGRVFTQNSHSELPARPPPWSRGCSPRRGRRGRGKGGGTSEAAPRGRPHLRAQRPGLLALRPRGLLLRRVAAAALPAPLVVHAASRAGRWPLPLAVTPPSPGEAASLSLRKTTALTFPRRRPHKLSRTPPTSGSVWRRHAAQAQWAGACAGAGGRRREEPGRAALGPSGRGCLQFPCWRCCGPCLGYA